MTVRLDVGIVELGRQAAFPAAAEPWISADIAARTAALATEPILGHRGLAEVDLAQVAGTVQVALAAVASRWPNLELVRRGDDGTDHRVGSGQMPRGATLSSNQGLIVWDLDQLSAPINVLVGRASVGMGRRVRAAAVLGSLPFELDRPAIDDAWVIPVAGPIVVRPGKGAPADVPSGSALHVHGWPRLFADVGSCTIVLFTEVLGGADRRAAIVDRAAHHPLLRLDVPTEGFDDVHVYGMDQTVGYTELVSDALGQVLDDAPFDELHRWWVLNRRLPPLAVGGRSGFVRARFPGGVGVVDWTSSGDLIAKAGGVVFVVPGSDVPTLELLAQGQVIEWPEGTGAAELMNQGIVEPCTASLTPILPCEQ